MKHIFLIIFGALLLFSCTSSFKEEIEKAKEMKDKVDLAKTEFDAIDINKVAIAKDQYTTDIAVFKHKYMPDTINQAQANMVSHYKYIKKGAKTVLGKYADIKNDLEISESQLEKLIFDMKHESLTSEEVEKYMESERMRNSEVISNVRNMKITHDKLIQIYDALSPKIGRIVDSLKKL